MGFYVVSPQGREIAGPQKKATQRRLVLDQLERARRFERPTLTLARLCSTPELRPHPVGEALNSNSARRPQEKKHNSCQNFLPSGSERKKECQRQVVPVVSATALPPSCGFCPASVTGRVSPIVSTICVHHRAGLPTAQRLAGLVRGAGTRVGLRRRAPCAPVVRSDHGA